MRADQCCEPAAKTARLDPDARRSFPHLARQLESFARIVEQELQEEGGTDFGFAFGDAGRFRVSVFRQKGNISLVLRLIPSRFLTFEAIGLPTITKALCRRPATSWRRAR